MIEVLLNTHNKLIINKTTSNSNIRSAHYMSKSGIEKFLFGRWKKDIAVTIHTKNWSLPLSCIHHVKYSPTLDKPKVITKTVTRYVSDYDDYDHKWDDHPSWYTDNKQEQRNMVARSIARYKEW